MHKGPSSANTGRCVYPGCKNKAERLARWRKEPCLHHGVQRQQCFCTRPPFHLFSFPKASVIYRNQWLKVISEDPAWQPRGSDYVCSLHFRDGEPTKAHPCPEKLQQKPNLTPKYPEESGDANCRVVVEETVCPICGVIINSHTLESHLTSHLNSNSDQERYVCDKCDQSFTVACELSRHKLSHSDKVRYACDICGKSFIEHENLEQHKMFHNDGRLSYQCEACGRTFNNKPDLGKHMRVHSGEKPFSCEICLKTFSRSSGLNLHKKTHAGEKAYQCPQCEKGFTKSVYLANHLKNHDVDLLMCKVCNKLLPDMDSLEIHKAKHDGKSYKCDKCERYFVREDYYLKHISTHDEKYNTCEICHKKFSRIVYLLDHMKSHAGEKPFQCPDCDTWFVRSADLTKHIRVRCWKKSLSPSQIDKAMPYKCSSCEEYCGSKTELARHLKEKHRCVSSTVNKKPIRGHQEHAYCRQIDSDSGDNGGEDGRVGGKTEYVEVSPDPFPILCKQEQDDETMNDYGE